MGRRAHTRKLGLWMNGAFVGTWSLHPTQGDTLQYDKAWRDSPQGRPLSLSLPFLPGNAPHGGEKVRAYFENLLPDSQEIRERIARRYQSGSTEAFALLAQIGRDCVGAVQILPENEAPAAISTIQAMPLNEMEVAQLLRETVAPLPALATAAEQDRFRISLAGAQEKTALLHFDGKWCLPQGSTPTSHIFKLPMGLVGNMKLDLRESVENEWLCTQILRAYGLPVAECQPLEFAGQKVLVVERFDRAWWQGDGDPILLRLPQEDMCQATGTPPMLKYEVDGGPGIERIMGILDGSRERDRDRRIFFQSQVLFWMLCAPDGHAKNFSLSLQPGGSYMLAPLYDVLSAYPLLGEGPNKLSPFRAKMAMAVRSRNAHWKMRDIQRRHWDSLGERFGVITADGRPARHIVDELVASTPAVIAKVRGLLPPSFPQRLANSILAGLQAAANQLASGEQVRRPHKH